MSKVSVVIPAFNSEKTIERALYSIINQEGEIDFDIIVVDDGSSDSTAEKVEGFASKNNVFITLFRQKNSGVASARNKGISIAKGDFIAFLDADDAWESNKTLKQLKFLNTTEFMVVGGGYLNRFIKNNDDNVDDFIPVTYEMQLIKQYFQPSTVIIKRHVFDKVNGFVDGRRYSEDALFFYYVTYFFKCAVLRDNLINYGDGKHPYASSSGLGSRLWKMELGELSNYLDLYNNNLIGFLKLISLLSFSILKYIRRVLISFLYKLSKNGDCHER